MKRFSLIALMTLSLGVGLILLTATPSMAVHKGSGDLTCGNCHTMHSSQGGTNGTAMGGAGGSFILLRNANVTDRSQVHNLCLQCHSQGGVQGGTVMNTGDASATNDTTPPKVLLTTPYAGGSPADFSTVGAGGDFAAAGFTYTGSGPLGGSDGVAALGKAHSIGSTTVAPPGNGTVISGPWSTLGTFTCTTCHDPHGTSSTAGTTNNINLFRNLKGNYVTATTGVQNPWTNMAGINAASSYVGGVNGGNNSQGTSPLAGTGNVWPVWRSAVNQNTYAVTATAPTLGGTPLTTSDGGANNFAVISSFCAQCHGAWHDGRFTLDSGDDWIRHPVNRRITDNIPTSGAGITITNFTWYNNGSTTTPNAFGTAATVASKLPVANNDATTGYFATSNADKVFCLSCHFAHGSPYNDILRWNYTSFVSSGNQTGNGIPSNVGCQQCHDR